jgi:hypothetical protein
MRLLDELNLRHIPQPLQRNYALEAIIDHADETPYFFPGYTGHGREHVRRVLEYIDALIPKGTELSPEEAYVLVYGAYLHDIGMLIKPSGLKVLLADALWANKWSEFVAELRRYPQKKLHQIYGDSVPVTIPDIQNMTDTDDNKRNAKTIGEFLRKHHHELAEYIARNGFPGRENQVLFDKNDRLMPLVAVLAKSHGMGLRDHALDEDLKNLGECNGVVRKISIYHLMALLRMADYLDAGECRAPVANSKANEPDSPISEMEWNWNQAVDFHYDWYAAAHETLTICADPDCTSVFLKVEEWLKSLQQALDTCWAVLGEKYHSNHRPELSIRRIASDIDEGKAKRKTLGKDFLTADASLRVNPDIVFRLIEPLYGNDPSYGVRELLTNSLDACRERERYAQNHGEAYTPEITCALDTKAKTFTITDNGIGMTADVLVNYFMTVGASFRDSEAWKRDNTDESGNAKVLRSGRFGVGVLAAFLLGDSVQVTTRSVHDALGYRFAFCLDGKCPEVERVACAVGTEMVVLMREERIEKLVAPHYSSRIPAMWYDWYFLETPKMIYLQDGAPVRKNKEFLLLPCESDTCPSGEEKWYYFKLTKGIVGHWHIRMVNPAAIRNYSEAYCNGILINSVNSSFRNVFGFNCAMILLSFFDRNAILPINLSRDDISYFKDFDPVRREIYACIVAQFFFVDLNEKENNHHVIFNDVFVVDAVNYDENADFAIGDDLRNFGFCKMGFIPLVECFIRLIGIEEIEVCELSKDMLRFDELSEKVKKDASVLTLIIDRTRCSSFIGGLSLANMSFPPSGQAFTRDRVIFRSYKRDDNWESDFDDDIILSSVIQDLFSTRDTEHYTDDLWIPYNLADRKRKFPKAWEALKKYVDMDDIDRRLEREEEQRQRD